MLHLLAVDAWVSASFPIIRIILMCIMVVLSVFMIAVVLFQPGGSDGLGAISGTSDTFFGKNKGKTTEGALKRLTIIAAVSLVVIAILFFVTMIIYNGVG